MLQPLPWRVRDPAGGQKPSGLFTHLATADEQDVASDRAQLERFAEVLRAISDVPRLVHAAASAGVATS